MDLAARLAIIARERSTTTAITSPILTSGIGNFFS